MKVREEDKMICKICNREIGSKGFDSHLRKHNITNKEYYDKYVKKESDGLCKICGKPTTFFGAVRGYGVYCGPKCAQLDPDTRNKYKETCLQKYGAENVYASEYGKEKIKQTVQKRYGVSHVLQNDTVKKKLKSTCIKRYGVENPQQNKQIKDKTSKTNLQRYGNPCAMQNPEKWKQIVKTMKSNGNYSSLEDLLEKFFKQNKIEYKPQHKEERYPYHCDFYLPKSDMFIEINGFWHHNKHFYDENNPKDKETVRIWKEKSKTKPQYLVALDVWTRRDVQKRQSAKQNHLNYVVLWNKSEVLDFIENFTNH